MENKQSKRRWKIPVLLVSAICILLASSFVFHTTAEAATLSYSLNGATFTMPMENDGTLSNVGLDTSLVSDYSVTSSNQYASGGMYDTGSLEGYTGTPVYVSQMPDCKYAVYNSGTITLYKTYGVETITPIASSDPYGGNSLYYVIPGYYATPNNYGAVIVSYDGETVYSFSSSSSYYYQVLGFFYLNSRYYLVLSNISAFRVYVLSESFALLQNIVVFNGKGTDYFACCLYGDDILIGARNSTLVLFDTNTNSYQSYDFSSYKLEFYGTSLISDGSSIFLFKGSSFYSLDLSSTTCVKYSAPLSFSTYYIARAWYCLETIYVSGSSSILKLSKSNSYYFDFGTYASNYIQNAKYVNFSVASSTSVNGGDVVGVKLDFGLSPEYLSTLTTYGLRLTGCTMLASIDDPSAVPVNFGYSPIVVKVNGTVVPRNSTSYDLIEEYNGVYLYSFISSVDFQGSTKISSLEIYLNCYIPEQLSKHSFSFPVSPIELYLEPVGGGGGESSDTSSAGTSSGGGGGNETGAPSEIPPESVFFEDTLYIYKKLPDGGFGWVTDWNIKDYKTISVFTGYAPSVSLSGYINSQLEQYVGTIRITYEDGRKSYIETDGTGIVGYGSSENSMVYPFSLGGWVDVELNENNYLYIDQNRPENLLIVGSGDSNFLQLNMRSDADLVFVRANDEDTDIGWVSGNGETGELTVRQKIWQLQKYGNVSGYYDTHYFSAGQFFSFHRYDFPPATTGGVFNGICFLNLYFYTGDKSPLEVSIEYSIYLEEQSRIAAEESYFNYLAGLAYGDMNFDADYSGGFGDAFDIQDGLYDAPAGAMITGTWDSLWDAHPFAFAMISTVIVFAIVKFIINKV